MNTMTMPISTSRIRIWQTLRYLFITGLTNTIYYNLTIPRQIRKKLHIKRFYLKSRTFFMSPLCYCLPIVPPFSPLLLHLPLLVHFSPQCSGSSLPLVFYLVRSLQAINSSATTCGFWLSLMRASILRT